RTIRAAGSVREGGFRAPFGALAGRSAPPVSFPPPDCDPAGGHTYGRTRPTQWRQTEPPGVGPAGYYDVTVAAGQTKSVRLNVKAIPPVAAGTDHLLAVAESAGGTAAGVAAGSVGVAAPFVDLAALFAGDVTGARTPGGKIAV